MTGIYKITSPSGKVYIGQSVEIEKRWRWYRNNNSHEQRHLHRSFLKHGVYSHKFEISHQLPDDVSMEVMNTYEIFYWQQHIDCGFKMLNIKEPGSNGRHSEETKKKIGDLWRGKKRHPSVGLKVSLTKASFPKEKWAEIGKKISASKVGKKKPASFAINISKSTKGIKVVPQWQLDICHAAAKVAVNKLSKDGIFIERFESVKEAAKSAGVKGPNISMCLSGKSKTSGGFKWEYAK